MIGQVDIKWNSVYTFESVQEILALIASRSSGEPVSYLHTQSMYVYEVSDQKLAILPRWKNRE